MTRKNFCLLRRPLLLGMLSVKLTNPLTLGIQPPSIGPQDQVQVTDQTKRTPHLVGVNQRTALNGNGGHDFKIILRYYKFN